jgi:hypothetical protein
MTFIEKVDYNFDENAKVFTEWSIGQKVYIEYMDTRAGAKRLGSVKGFEYDNDGEICLVLDIVHNKGAAALPTFAVVNPFKFDPKIVKL